MDLDILKIAFDGLIHTIGAAYILAAAGVLVWACLGARSK